MPDLTYAPRPGWTLTSDTWVYASATSFTIAGVDRTAQFPIGAKVQYTNGGTTKYAYVASAAFSTNTTVTLLANSTYSIANSAITEPKYSYQDTPAGFPNWGSADQNSALALEVASNVSKLSTSRRNRIINGDMHIDQRNAGAASTLAGIQFLVDRFEVGRTGSTGTVTGQQSTLGNSSSAKITATSAMTDLTAGNYVWGVRYIAEAQDIYDLNGKTITVSFKVETNWTGNLSIAIRKGGWSRSYLVNAAVVSGVNTVSVAIPLEADTVGVNNNTVGLEITIGFCNEGNFTTATTGSWVAASAVTSTSSTQWAKTTGNFINVTELQLEEGAVATAFERRPHGEEFALCQRYYQKSESFIQMSWGSANTSGIAGGAWVLPVIMRATPTLSVLDTLGAANKVTYLGGGAASTTGSAINSTGRTASAIYVRVFSSGAHGIQFNYTLNAEL